MMTIEKLNEFRAKYQEEADYYEIIQFPIMQSKFQGVLDFLDEMEETIRERDELRERIARMTTMTNYIAAKIEENKNDT